MKRILATISTLLFCLTAAAQVDKQVEVTKQYIPKLPQARKLAIEPSGVDTVSIRPEIDYTIQPKAISSALGSERFRPATVTYWEYAPQYPFYLKAGIGYPLASEVDFYASSHRADVGYIMAYGNHLGEFNNIEVENYGGIYNNNAKKMVNRVGVNGGKYIGRYTFGGDVYYKSDIYNRFPQNLEAETPNPAEVNFEDVSLSLNFGDSFADLSKFNFSIYGSADIYNDKSEQWLRTIGTEQTDEFKLQQINADAGVKIARQLGSRGDFAAAIGYEGFYGLQQMKEYKNTILSAELFLGYRSVRHFNIKAGARVSHDNLPMVYNSAKLHILPYLYMGLNMRHDGTFVPYVEFDSKLTNNSYQNLQSINQYILFQANNLDFTALPNSVSYNMRIGLTGHSRNNKFAYKLYANVSFITNSLYWYNYSQAFFDVKADSENIASIFASLEYKPISSLFISAKANAILYEELGDLMNGKPKFEANLNFRYTHRKFAIGASADFVSATKWSIMDSSDNLSTLKYPSYIDLSANFDWMISKTFTLYIEGRNLANADIYHLPLYKEYGTGALIGIKVQF